MNDNVVEEVRRIREQLYEESKSLTPEERRKKSHVASDWFRQKIAECRAKKNLSPPSFNVNDAVSHISRDTTPSLDHR